MTGLFAWISLIYIVYHLSIFFNILCVLHNATMCMILCILQYCAQSNYTILQQENITDETNLEIEKYIKLL